MIAVDRINAEIAKYDAILARRGAWHEDEKVARDSFAAVRQWLQDDKDESERIELEAMEAAEAAEEAERRADPNFKTREMFKNVKITIPTKGK